MEERINCPDRGGENGPLNRSETVLKRPQNRKKRGIGWTFILLTFLLTAILALFYVNDFALDIALAGEMEMLLEYGDAYREPGVQPVLRGKWLFSSGIVLPDVEVKIETDLQEDVLGKYTVTYSSEFHSWKASAQRQVRVVDNVCPVITLKKTGQTVLPGHRYEEEGYVAVDNHDGNLTDKVHRVEKQGVITYTVVDSSGNPASVQREIAYYDPTPPELVLLGGEEITIPCGTFFEDPGYTAVDNADGDMTEEVAIEGEVVWYEPGVYTVAYTIADSFGNVSQKIRRVTVEGKPWREEIWPNGKVIYLTFDDGPGPDTIALLDLLKRYGVKATFFVTNSGSNGELWRMYKEGHSIGIHTMTHDYNAIYSSEEAFFKDLYGMQDIIYRETGIKTTLMRFPGGGSNLVSDFNEGIMTRLSKAVQDSGFQYFDWNVDSNDAGGARRRETVAGNVIDGIQKQPVSVVLQHDIHGFSVAAVEDIILWGLEQGYQFLPLTPSSPTMHHTVLN